MFFSHGWSKVRAFAPRDRPKKLFTLKKGRILNPMLHKVQKISDLPPRLTVEVKLLIFLLTILPHAYEFVSFLQ